jgi:hypothetical protein
MAHLTFGFIALAPLMAFPQFANKHRNTLTSHWKGIACVGVFKVGTTRTPFSDHCEVHECCDCGGDALAPIGTHRGLRVSTLQVANIVANNASLVLISLSLNQIIRSGIPIVTAFLGILIEKTVRTGSNFWHVLFPELPGCSVLMLIDFQKHLQHIGSRQCVERRCPQALKSFPWWS